MKSDEHWKHVLWSLQLPCGLPAVSSLPFGSLCSITWCWGLARPHPLHVCPPHCDHCHFPLGDNQVVFCCEDHVLRPVFCCDTLPQKGPWAEAQEGWGVSQEYFSARCGWQQLSLPGYHDSESKGGETRQGKASRPPPTPLQTLLPPPSRYWVFRRWDCYRVSNWREGVQLPDRTCIYPARIPSPRELH